VFFILFREEIRVGHIKGWKSMENSPNVSLESLAYISLIEKIDL